jgi:putative sterol carrier protein
VALFPSDEWMTIYQQRINASSEYREAAATWEGAVAFVFEAEPDHDVPDDLWALLDLWHGECRDARMLEQEEGERAPYVIRAPYSRWKEVLRGDLDPVKGMMQGKLKVQGDLAMIVRYVRAANELVHLTMQVPTRFIDEPPAS